ncbi:MAG: hypothetical protein WKF94_00375 [Solirubrobacteraceae bacterium]
MLLLAVLAVLALPYLIVLAPLVALVALGAPLHTQLVGAGRHSRQETSLALGEAQYVLSRRKQLKLPIPQPLVGGGRLDRRLHDGFRLALDRNRRITSFPARQLVLRVAIERARTWLPSMDPVTVPPQLAAAFAIGASAEAGPATRAKATISGIRRMARAAGADTPRATTVAPMATISKR